MTPSSPAPDDALMAAREASLLEREREADVREAALEVREAEIESTKVAQVGRDDDARRILDDADRRDEVSDARDVRAEAREVDASRAAFLDRGPGRGPRPEVRRAAALDRIHSKHDRTAAASDRDELVSRSEPVQTDDA